MAWWTTGSLDSLATDTPCNALADVRDYDRAPGELTALDGQLEISGSRSHLILAR